MTVTIPANGRLCVLRLSALGDVCNAIAAVQAFAQQRPDVHITWIASKVESQLLTQVDNIEVITVDKSNLWRSWQQLRQLPAFDVLWHMQYALRASWLSTAIRAPIKLGFNKQRQKDGQGLFINRCIADPSGEHVLDGFMQFAYACGADTCEPSWQLNISASAKAYAAQQLGAQKTLLICPGSSKAEKNWHAQGYVHCAQLAQQHGWQVVLIGSPHPLERKLGAEIEQQLPVKNLIGATSIEQLLALIAHAQLMLAPDTGPVHLANALQTPVMALYAHHNPQRVGPYHYRQLCVSIYQQLLGGNAKEWRSRNKDANAMAQLDEQQVLRQLTRLLTQGDVA